MHVHFLDPYRPGQSPIHKLDSRVKFVLTLAFIFAAALTPTGAWAIYILLLALVLGVEVLSELRVGYVLKRAALALPFILAALPIVFTMPGEPRFILSIGPWALTASLPGLERFISIAIKSWVSVQAAIVLASTTEFPDLLMAMRAVRVPRLLVSIFGLMWRYLFVLADEAIRLMRARLSRSGVSDQAGLKPGGSLAWRARVTGGMAGSLFVRAFERSDRIYMAMLARGYDGEARSEPLQALSGASWVVLALSLFTLLALLVFALLFWA
ncbi:MAG: cobalt ECF transporter T component CbiQ [Anaerolineae bacterium UTCFX2]|jgi:cobalt/nickel transport system permease protein|nr:cobalt ECF transporter T component CbiQ [Anaerolineales bacterium]OQY94266.1 MAG: cobalt ECF transporter T component CbiQ [Anaerolineae bacterium UTCFX2]